MAAANSPRALVSVSDKTGLDPFVRGLADLGFEILSTGGTRRFLEELQIPVLDVSAYTEFPEIMDGRVKTLHPRVHGAILGRPHLPEDQAVMAEHGIQSISVVVCNLYPFEQTVAREGVSPEEAIEQIDIGGPSMIRSAAKNHATVAVVTSPDQYADVLAQLQAGTLDEAARRRLAQAAFERTARYDAAISSWFAGVTREPDSDSSFPAQVLLQLDRRSSLRYGENPHQPAAFYTEPNPPAGSLATAEQLHGKELSYNNLLDLDAALTIARDFSETAAVVLKHNNPCGCAVAENQADALAAAWAGDPVSAFGSILGFNRPLTAATAEQLCEPNRFVEAIIAPDFDAEAIEILTTRPKWKNNVRLLRCAGAGQPAEPGLDYRRVTGGLLMQEADVARDPEEDWKSVTDRTPSAAELADLKFAWQVCRYVKSNAIVFAKDRALVGVGAGQMSRLDSSFMAAHKAGERSKGAVVASDAFFPFRDGIDQAAAAGVTAAIQPGGSRNDEEVIAACNEHGIAMMFTGRRHFRH
ncbi:MAG: bifunctional phosphoribosylaminoimidazolecarboxamide formyltransferase/IMP cyclohydrolase [Planctomycetaceae bacterium]|nr:bifunctional phosphoribosylaminoimidazolecarboxamide formyltransferase/IMP cyclohydrolase [Planctomycetaceae bacterium]